MLFYKKEAYETVHEKIRELNVKLASTAPTKDLCLTDIQDIMFYLKIMDEEINRRIKKWNKYNPGDIVTVRDESELAKVVKMFCDNGEWFYEIEAVELENVPNREVKERDLRAINGRIIEHDDQYRYFDMNGNELHAGDIIQYTNGSREKLYLTSNNRLGTDATNPAWIESGRAVPCQFGIYPLERSDLCDCVKVNN